MTDLELSKKIAEFVSSYGGSTYFVGGYVRDLLLGKENKDIDLEIHGISYSALKKILESLGKVKEQGASFGVFNLKGYDLDIAMPRCEQSTGRGHRDFEVFVDPHIGLEKATSRRDFTINALMMDVLTGEIIDLHGGRQDLEKGIIRHVDSSTFLEDPLRVLRAAQFAARFEFSIAPETINLCKSADLSSLSPERIQTELEKALLKAKRPSIFFESLREMSQLSSWFPELIPLISTEQDLKHHPEGSVWNHTMMVLDKAAKKRKEVSYPFGFMLAALYHDIGKAKTTTMDEKGIHSYDHHHVGAKMIQDIPYLQEKKLLRYVENMVDMHMDLHRTLKETSKPTTFCKIYDQSVCPNDLILLTECDRTGRGIFKKEIIENGNTILKENLDYSEKRKRLIGFLEIYEERMKQPCVTGKDLVEAGFMPSPLFSEALSMGHNFQVSGVPKKSALSQVLGFMKKEERKRDKNIIVKKKYQDLDR